MKEEHVEILVKHRLQQARDALNDARILLESNGSAQSILNRSYYAMFYAALAILQRHQVIPSKHTGVISFFDREFIAKGIFPKELSKSFHKAFDLRQASDYKVIEPLSSQNVEKIHREASLFVDTVADYLLSQNSQR